ncbi:hypothetical protein Dimus_021774 [Dionaea muscipula]
MEWQQLPEAAVPQFREGIQLLLSNWPALQMAVENEWGGPHSHTIAAGLVLDIFNWFAIPRGEPLYFDDLEDLLDDLMLSLNTEVDDGSIQETAEKLMTMHEECLQGNFVSIQRLRESVPHAVPVRHIEQVMDVGQNIRNEDTSNMSVDTPESSSMSNPVQDVGSDGRPQLMEEAELWTTEEVSKHPSLGFTMNMMTFIFIVLIISAIITSPPPLGTCQSLFSRSAGQGVWQFLQESIGISAMHMQLLHNDKVVMFDRTDFGKSNLSLPGGLCRYDSHDLVLPVDCSAHSILYDIVTNSFRPLMVHTDTWCSSGSVLSDGTLLQTGGFNDGDHVVRTFSPCEDESCDWVEHSGYLARHRWYASNQILPDGRVIIIGGRRQYSYEFYPRDQAGPAFNLGFLRETRESCSEDNLYPFIHLLPDGNLFIFANTRAIAFDYNQHRVVREFPSIPGGEPRNYPSTGSSVLLPIDENRIPLHVEVLVCGGAPPGAFLNATRNRVFLHALNSCGRIAVSDQNPMWVMESMPLARVMGDMLLLPNGDVMIINGAGSGTAGWEDAVSPVTRPVMYRPTNVNNQRFAVMDPATRPRLYHSSAILLTDGRVLVGGSNPHEAYDFANAEFPTDLSLEAYAPPYLSAEYAPVRPTILFGGDRVLRYRVLFSVTFSVQQYLTAALVSVNIIAPSFTTHSFAMNQRMVVLTVTGISPVSATSYRVVVLGPSRPEIAPPGYYLLFVVHAGIPSSGMWVHVLH